MDAATRPRLDGRLVAVMAVASGAIVANLYYAQPLLHQVARSFSVGSAATALVVTATQAGYALGLLLVVPLGDLHPRRTLVVGVYALAAAGLVVCAAAPALWLFELASVVTGLASVAGQIMIPLAADLAEPARRGRIMARIMTGMLVGILLARTLAGIVAQAWGWRAIFWVSAGLMVALAAVLRSLLPPEAPRPHLSYARLVASSLRLLVEHPQLRRRAWYGATCFGAFSVLWTSLAFLLAGPHYRYSNLVIGLFGLAGVGGVAAANLAGRLADTSRRTAATVGAAALTAGSFALLAGGRTSLALLVAGIVALDMGAQGMQIVNQAVIYELVPEARSRANSSYMTVFFIGGAVGSVSAGSVLAADGWTGISWLGAGFGALALAMALYERLRPSPALTPPPVAARPPAPVSPGRPGG